jgi:hypothetical protein
VTGVPSGTGEVFEVCNDTVIEAESPDAVKSRSSKQFWKRHDLKVASDCTSGNSSQAYARGYNPAREGGECEVRSAVTISPKQSNRYDACRAICGYRQTIRRNAASVWI